MVEQSFWEMLRTKRDSLTKSGGIVADYLVQHAEDAQYLSLAGKCLRRGRGNDLSVLPLAGL